MASTSASSTHKDFKFDVYLSFRAEDTSKNFVDHLCLTLQQKGIITYKDDERIQKGERISEQLIRSIQDSRFHIIVFSKKYASSSWCLDELTKIMECQKITEEQTAYPVFYDVEPTAVGEAFAFTRNRKRMLEDVDLEEEEDAGRWRYALTEAASLSGWELKNTFDGSEAKLIQEIVEEISPKLLKPSFSEKLVGMEARVEDVLSCLKTCLDDVLMIGIKGLGGGGKTTLARAVFSHISSQQFQGKSFVENVREGSKGSGLKELQKKVLQNVFNDKSIDVESVYDGRNLMKKMMGSRKVLVVLDDVDDIDQLEALAGDLTWFKPGSRIIITTRDVHVLVAHRVKFIHDVNLLSHEEAICLFSRYAFGREIPIERYEKLSTMIVHYAAGLPLTIKVLGSHLCGRSEHEWVDALKRLETIPLEDTLEKLELSYNGLEDDQKEIFLDIACILKGEKKDEATKILEGCGFNAQIGLRVLEQKSLITISDTECLRLHDCLEEMGMNIVRRVHPNEPSRHSRLWVKEEIEDILVNESGTEATRSIKLQYSVLHPAIIMKGLRNMTGLRFFYKDNGYGEWKVDEVSQYLPDALRYLYWRNYPFQCFSITFGANISQRGERKVLNKLRFIGLAFSKLRTFDLRLTPDLETLDLRGCNDFVELHMPVECPKLKYLNLSGSRLSNFNLGMTPNLEELYLEECNDFVQLHISEERPKLKVFNLGCSKASNLNPWLTPLLEKLESLEKLTLSVKDITHLPDSIYILKHLKYIELESCWFLEQLPKDFDRLECLEELRIVDCTSLRDIPNSISNMKCLKCLHLPHCILVKKLPEELGHLHCLKELNIEGTGITHLPQSIFQLKGLCIVWSWGRLELHGFTSLKIISEYVASCYV